MEREYYKETRNKSKNKTDRYKDCKVLEDVDTGEILLSYREPLEIPLRSSDIYHRVKSHEVGRLDLIAHQYYQNPLLWWVIAAANDISDPLALLESGTMIRVPSIETLYGNNGILL